MQNFGLLSQKLSEISRFQKGYPKVEIIKQIRRTSESESTSQDKMFYQLHFFTLIVMGVCTVCSELWGIVGAMGYCRIYGVMSELWVILHMVTLRVMGYSRNYGLFSELWGMCVSKRSLIYPMVQCCFCH